MSSQLIVRAGGALEKNAAEPKPVTTRKRCPPPTPVFTGRDDILLQINKYFTGPSKWHRIFVLFGLGGSGKSEISRMFVQISQENEPKRYSFAQ